MPDFCAVVIKLLETNSFRRSVLIRPVMPQWLGEVNNSVYESDFVQI